MFFASNSRRLASCMSRTAPQANDEGILVNKAIEMMLLHVSGCVGGCVIEVLVRGIDREF